MGSSGTRRRRPRQDREEKDDDDDQDVLILVPSLSSGEDEEGDGDFVFAETRTCWDLEVWIQGALFTQNSACAVTQGNTYVTTSINGKSISTKKAGPFGSSVVWNERLSLGCHLSSEPLVFQLYAGGNDKSPPCAQWTMDDWLAQAALNDIPAGGPEEDVQANTLVLPGRVNLMIQLASFVNHDPPPKKGVIALDDISFDSTKAIGGLVGGVLLLLFVVFVSLWCCCFCCCPRTYQERRRRFWEAYGPSTAAAAAAPATRPRPLPPPPPPPPPSTPWYSRPPPFTTTSNSTSSSSSNTGGGGGGLFSSFNGRPQPYAPSASAPSAYGQSQEQQQQQPQVAVAMPVAEAIGPSYREGGGSVPLAEARVMTSFNDGRGGGGRGGGRGGGGGGGGRQDRGRKISV